MKNHLKSRRNWLLASAATGLVVMAAPAIAQETDDDVETIRVTGFRAAIESSIEAKRENTSIVEAISAEDIGKLPDVSIAESLARLPGLAAQRVRGRAQVLSVRGLGPDFTTALLNGREQVTSGDNRGVEFDQYPAELVNQVLVYKTPDAQLVASGLAGTADIQTIRPLEFGRESLTLSASYEWTSQDQLNADVDDTGHRFTGTYVNQFADDTIGVVLGFANQSTPTHAETYEITGWQSDRGPRTPEGFKMFSESRELERTAVLGTLEFEPNAVWNTSIDVMYTEFTDGGVRRGVEIPLGTWLGCCTSLNLAPGFQVEDGFITEGQFRDAFAVGRNDVQSREAELFAFGWNTQYQISDNWRLESDVSYSRVERTALDFETYFGLGADRSPADDVINFAYAGGRYRFNSMYNYADPNLMVLTDPGGWGQDGFNKTLSTDDELFALRGSATRDFASGPFSSMEFGAYYTQREKERRTDEYFVDLTSGNASDPIDSQYLISPTSLDWVANFDVLSYDPNRLLADGVYSLRALPLGFIPNKQWNVEEDVLVLYAQANVDTTVFGAPTRGNIGVQIVDTDQSSTGPIGFGTDFLPVLATDGDGFTEVLPSANFSFEVAEDTFLRLGVARTLARARMDDMRASVNLSTNSTVCPQAPDGSLISYNPSSNPGEVCLSGGSGNPQLRPYIADSFDISLEHYFADGGGYFSVAFFHKEIDTWVFGSVARPFDGSEIVDAVFGAGTSAANPGIGDARFSAPENTDGGWLRGIELSANVPGEVVGLEGFGLFATYSQTESEITPGTTTTPITIPGLSESLGNITLYYERDGFEARVSNRWRDPFLAELPDFTGQPDFRNAFSESVVDAQIGYVFGPGRFDGVSVQFQANNLTDERFGTFLAPDRREVRNWQEYGTTYALRINYRR
jgi:iron complex outermembrane receptor protein